MVPSVIIDFISTEEYTSSTVPLTVSVPLPLASNFIFSPKVAVLLFKIPLVESRDKTIDGKRVLSYSFISFELTL